MKDNTFFYMSDFTEFEDQCEVKHTFFECRGGFFKSAIFRGLHSIIPAVYLEYFRTRKIFVSWRSDYLWTKFYKSVVARELEISRRFHSSSLLKSYFPNGNWHFMRDLWLSLFGLNLRFFTSHFSLFSLSLSLEFYNHSLVTPPLRI